MKFLIFSLFLSFSILKVHSDTSPVKLTAGLFQKLGQLDADTIPEGENVYLKCDYKTVPSLLSVTWWQNGKPLHSNLEEGRIVSYETLILKHVSASTNGEYYCEAKNPKGNIKSNIVKLNIIKSPTSEDVNDNIINGREAPEGEYPFIVSLQAGYSDGKGMHFCGGAILNERWIVTATHCVWDIVHGAEKVPYSVFARVGMINSTCNDAEQAQFVKVDKFVIHDGYDLGTAANDISLLRLSEKLNFTAKVHPVQLPSESDALLLDALIMGWGAESMAEFHNANYVCKSLKVADVKLSTPQDCIDFYKTNMQGELDKGLRLPENYTIDGIYPHNGGKPTIINPEKEICLARPEDLARVCRGDSGGPLIQYVNGKAVLKGVVSRGLMVPNCENSSSMFSRVQSFLPWIHQTISDLN